MGLETTLEAPAFSNPVDEISQQLANRALAVAMQVVGRRDPRNVDAIDVYHRPDAVVLGFCHGAVAQAVAHALLRAPEFSDVGMEGDTKVRVPKMTTRA